MSTRPEDASHFWDLANSVTVFAVIQMIAYLMALGAGESEIRPGVIEIRGVLLIVIVAATISYCGAVAYFSWCHRSLLGTVDPSHRQMLFVTASLRIAVIALAAAGGYFVTQAIQPVSPPV